MTDNLRKSGVQIEDGYCFYNKSAICLYPPVELLPGNIPIWNLYNQTTPQYVGMDGIPMPRTMTEVRAACDALEIPFDQRTVRDLKIIEDEFIKRDRRHRDEEQKKVKK
jgi:hypothetical protein